MYTIIFRKGQIELELTTDDKNAVEKQLDLIIKQANSHSLKTKNESNNVENKYIEPIINTNNSENNVEKTEKISTSNNELIQPAIFEHIREDEKQSIIQKAEDVVPQTLEISSAKPMTINSIQNPEPEPEPDFDKILNNEIEHNTNETPILKDEKFIEFVEGKSALEKCPNCHHPKAYFQILCENY